MRVVSGGVCRRRVMLSVGWVVLGARWAVEGAVERGVNTE